MEQGKNRLDKELYRRVYESLREWSEAERIERARNAGTRAPQETWRQYVAVVEFAWKLAPQLSEWQYKRKLADLAHYYEQVARLEAWRRMRGKVT